MNFMHICIIMYPNSYMEFLICNSGFDKGCIDPEASPYNGNV